MLDPRISLQKPDQSNQETRKQPILRRLIMAKRDTRLSRSTAISKLDQRKWMERG